MPHVQAIPAFRDNYIWALCAQTTAVLVDPGDARPVEAWLDACGKRPVAVLVTHHHPDHVGGLPRLRARYGMPVFGPAAESVPGLDHALAEGDVITPAAGYPAFTVLEVPGHTAGHIAYWAPGLLFCGDTLFSAGCGRLFEGTAAQMLRSLQRLAALPPDTAVYPAHEYTVANLRFARSLVPGDAAVEKALANALKIRENGQATLPSTIAREREINVFLRTGERAVAAAAERAAEHRLIGDEQVFAELRRCKDRF